MLLTRPLTHWLFVSALFAMASAPTLAFAQRDTTAEALLRMEEVLTLRHDGGTLDLNTLAPSMVVSATPAFEESLSWYPTAALNALVRVMGSDALRFCEACLAPRTFVQEGKLEQFTSAMTVEEIVRLDNNARGTTRPARTAIWLDENASGVSLRIIDLQTGRIILAENFDPRLSEAAASEKSFTRSEELMRRSRAQDITQTFVDIIAYPGQHIAFDWTEQWGDTNQNLSGVSVSVLDPVLGLGGAYYRAFPDALNLLVGGKILMSFPTALVRAVSSEDVDVVDNLLTAVFMLRIPIASSNYAVSFSASTNGNIGIGISLMNISLFPVLQ